MIIIRATILVFALMLYVMVSAGGQINRATPSLSGGNSSPEPKEAAAFGERPAQARTAASTKIFAFNHPDLTQQRAYSPEGKVGLPLLNEAALHSLTYAAAEKAISEQLTGQPATHGQQLKVRQALILGCGLMMREARSVEAESRGKYVKLDMYRPLADSAPHSVLHAPERTY